MIIYPFKSVTCEQDRTGIFQIIRENVQIFEAMCWVLLFFYRKDET